MGINSLPVGYILKDDYKIIQNLGQGGFGITYLAEDTTLGHKVVIKEFLPQSMATRDQSRYTVTPYTKGDSLFDHLLTRFTEEARLLAGLRHPNIVKVTRLLEDNETAYFIMEYEEGETLEDYLEHTSEITEKTMLAIMMPILEGTKYVHNKGILHRDIAPDNIYLKLNGMPMLIDFGAARNAIASESQKLSAIAKDGYSPPEQYTANSDQNASTDIYALGAVMYRMITGNKPANAAQRQMALLENQLDPIGDIVENYKNKYSKSLLEAIRKALNLSQNKRFQTIQEFQEAISKGIPEEDSGREKKKFNILGLIFFIVIILIVGFGFQKYNYSVPDTVTSIPEEKITIAEKKQSTTPLQAEPIRKKKIKRQSKENACNSGDYKECSNLGVEYVNGKKKEKNYFKAVKLFKRACEHNNAKGCYNLAIMYHKGQGLRQDYLQAAKFYKEACLNGDARGCSNLGFLYEKGEGVSQDNNKAANYYAKACDGGITEGCSNLGYMYENGQGVDKNEPKALELYTKVCDSDDVIGCYNLGYMYESGKGTDINYVKAAKLYKKACDENNVDGCISLGSLYENGQGVSVDKSKALDLYRKACDNNGAEGCYQLAVLYNSGVGIVKDNNKAVIFFQKACDAGINEGCYNLGYMYENGQGVNKDKDKAKVLYAQACQSGNAIGCCNIGFIYEKNRELSKAKEYYGKACDMGESFGCENFTRLN